MKSHLIEFGAVLVWVSTCAIGGTVRLVTLSAGAGVGVVLRAVGNGLDALAVDERVAVQTACASECALGRARGHHWHACPLYKHLVRVTLHARVALVLTRAVVHRVDAAVVCTVHDLASSALCALTRCVESYAARHIRVTFQRC